MATAIEKVQKEVDGKTVHGLKRTGTEKKWNTETFEYDDVEVVDEVYEDQIDEMIQALADELGRIEGVKNELTVQKAKVEARKAKLIEIYQSI